MPTEVIWVQANDAEHGGYSGTSVECPVWSRVETCIERAFRFGGQVKLYSGNRGDDERIRLGTFIGMESHLGEFRLVYSPETRPDEKTKQREWWEPGDTAFRGTTVFHDHEWDDRTVCRDISVAMHMFRDFFEHGGLTEVSLSQTRSVWDRKPRD